MLLLNEIGIVLLLVVVRRRVSARKNLASLGLSRVRQTYAQRNGDGQTELIRTKVSFEQRVLGNQKVMCDQFQLMTLKDDIL